MIDFSPARTRALLDLYGFAKTRTSQLNADIAEHAVGLALSERRSDPFLARNAIRNARCTLLRRVRRDVRRQAQLPEFVSVDGGFDTATTGNVASAAAQPPSPERALIMRDAFNMLLDEVQKGLGVQGVEVARRYLDPMEDVAADLGVSTSTVKRLRAEVRNIAERLADEVRP